MCRADFPICPESFFSRASAGKKTRRTSNCEPILDYQLSIIKGNMLKAIIFDFNGVIVDDEPLHLELFRRVLGEVGVPLSDEDYHAKYLGYDDRGCFTAALRDAGREQQSQDVGLINDLIARKEVYYHETINDRFMLFPGVVKLVKRLAEKYPMAVVSGALRSEIEVVLKRGGIYECFQTIISSEDVSACKPDPEGYVNALAALNSINGQQFIAAECLVIEDSIAGVQSAKRAGMKCLAVTNSYQAEELKEADWIVTTLVDCEPERLFASAAGIAG